MTDSIDKYSYLQGYVRIPDQESSVDWYKEQAPVLFGYELDDPLDGLAIESRLLKFEETKNAVLAAEAFVIAMNAGVYPPLDVLKWLKSGLLEYLEGQGKDISLDAALGLKAAGKGGTPPFKQLLLDDRDQMLMHEMDILISLGANQIAAASAVAEKLSQSDWNKTRHDMSDISVDTLRKRYREDSREKISDPSRLGLESEEDIKTFLKTFPYLSLPKKLAQKYLGAK